MPELEDCLNNVEGVLMKRLVFGLLMAAGIGLVSSLAHAGWQ